MYYKVNYNLLCTYNKRRKVFNWKNTGREITDVDELFQEVISYTSIADNRKIIVTGFEACYRYIEYLKDKLSNDIALKKHDFEVFWNFKSHVKALIENIFTNNYVVTSSSLCNDYLKVFKQCEMVYKNEVINFKSFLELIDTLHMQEKDILSKAYGLRVIKYAK